MPNRNVFLADCPPSNPYSNKTDINKSTINSGWLYCMIITETISENARIKEASQTELEIFN